LAVIQSAAKDLSSIEAWQGSGVEEPPAAPSNFRELFLPFTRTITASRAEFRGGATGQRHSRLAPSAARGFRLAPNKIFTTSTGDPHMKTYLKTTAMLLALAGIFAAPAVFAQTADTAAPPPDSPGHMQHMIQHRVAYLTTVLTLTTAQQTQITNAMTTAATSKSTNHSAMKTAHDSLQTAIHSNDAAGMEAASNTIANLMAQEMLAHAKTEAAIYQLLTPEQQTKFSALESEGHRGGGPRGFGGGPGPGH
jgi:periplasmic protein CpxP/Spy